MVKLITCIVSKLKRPRGQKDSWEGESGVKCISTPLVASISDTAFHSDLGPCKASLARRSRQNAQTFHAQVQGKKKECAADLCWLGVPVSLPLSTFRCHCVMRGFAFCCCSLLPRECQFGLVSFGLVERLLHICQQKRQLS